MKVIIILGSTVILLKITEVFIDSWIKSLMIKDLAIPATQFVRLILNEIETAIPCNKPYHLELRYYETRNIMGRYFFDRNVIQIYFSKTSKLLEVTDTIIHEYCHHLQNDANKLERTTALEMYDYEYWNHPWEIEARRIAKQKSLKLLKQVIL